MSLQKTLSYTKNTLRYECPGLTLDNMPKFQELEYSIRGLVRGRFPDSITLKFENNELSWNFDWLDGVKDTLALRKVSPTEELADLKIRTCRLVLLLSQYYPINFFDSFMQLPKDSYTLKAINGKIMSYDTFCHENKLFTSMEIASHVLGIRPYHKSLSPNIRHWTNIDD